MRYGPIRLSGVDHDPLGQGLERAMVRFKEHRDLERDVREWFEDDVPAPTVPPDFIERALQTREPMRLPSAPASSP